MTGFASSNNVYQNNRPRNKTPQSFNIERDELNRQINILRQSQKDQDPQFETQMVQLNSHNQVLVQKVQDFQDIIESQKVQAGFFETERQNLSQQINGLNHQIQQTQK